MERGGASICISYQVLYFRQMKQERLTWLFSKTYLRKVTGKKAANGGR